MFGKTARCALAGAVLVGAPLAHAASTATGNIVELAFQKTLSTNAVFVRLDTAPSPLAACSVNGYWSYTFPPTTSFDGKVYALLVEAYAMGKPVSIGGSGSCSEFNSIESAASLDVQN